MYKTILSLILCGVGAAYAAESFEDATAGDFESLETSLGTLKALSPASVISKFAKDGDQSICIQGGKNKSLQLDFAKPLDKDQSLILWAGVPAGKGAAMLKTYVLDANGEKHLIDTDKKMPAGKLSKKMEFKLPSGSTGLLWVMTSTVKEGLAFDSIELQPIEWSYAGASMAHAYAFPIMRDGAINPVVRINVPDNLDLTSISLKVSPAASVKAVGVAVGPDNATRFAERKHYIEAEPNKEGVVVLRNDTLIPGGNDPLWISIIPSEKAPIGSEIRISDVRVMSGKDECRSLASSTHRVGAMIAAPGTGVIDPVVRDAKPVKGEEPVPPRISKFFRAPGLIRSSKRGQLVACFDARYGEPGELRNDADIVVATSKDNGQTWTQATIALDAGEGSAHGCSRASIVDDKGNLKIHAATCVLEEGESPSVEGITQTDKGTDDKPDKHTTWQWVSSTSADAGNKWDKELKNHTKQIVGKNEEWVNITTGSGTGIVTSEGVLVYPAVISTGTKTDDFHAAICYSTDGRKWAMSAPLPESTASCTIAELRDGSIMINAHDRKIRGKRVVYTTKDLGKTWKEHESNGKALDYLSEQCGLLAVQHKTYGKLLLFVSGVAGSNVKQELDAKDKPKGTPSQRMTIRYSKDDGKTWSKGYVFDDRPGLAGASLTMVSADSVGVLYESPRGVNLDGEDYGISFLKIPLKEIMEAK